MPSLNPRALGAVVIVLTAPACLFDPKVPADAVLSCADNADCPDGQRCASGVGRCVADSGDSEAPSLIGDPRITPPQATIGTVLTLDLEAVEAFGGDPVVTLRSSAGDTRTMTPVSVDGTRASFAFTVSSAEVPGEWSAEAELVDRASNTAVVGVGSVLIDIAAPQVVAVAGDALLNANSDTVAVRVDFDEPVPTAPVLVASVAGVDEPTPWAASAVSDRVWQFQLTDVAALDDGALALRVTASDAAGNSEQTVLAHIIIVDRTPPFATAGIRGGNDTVFAPTPGHDVVVVDVDTHEPDATVALDGTPCAAVGGTLAECLYDVEGNEGEAVTLPVVVTDAGGNVQALIVTALIDAVGPEVIAPTVSVTLTAAPGAPRSDVTAMAVGTTLDLTFQTVDAVSPVVMLGAVAIQVVSGLGVAHAARHTLGAGELPDGAAALRVLAVDALGNASDVNLDADVRIDTVAPASLAGNAEILYERDASQGTLHAIGVGLLEQDGAIQVTGHLQPALVLGMTTATAAGAFADVTFSSAPHATVDVVHIDHAGNMSAPAQVRTVDILLRGEPPRTLPIHYTTALRDDAPPAPAIGGVGLAGSGTAPYFELEDDTIPVPLALRRDLARGGLLALTWQGGRAFDGLRWRPREARAAPELIQLGALGDEFATLSPTVNEGDAMNCLEGCWAGFASVIWRERFHTYSEDAVLTAGESSTALPSGAWRIGATPALDGAGDVLFLGGVTRHGYTFGETLTCILGSGCDLTFDAPVLDVRVAAEPPSPRSRPGAVLDIDRNVIVLFGGETSADTMCGTGGAYAGNCVVDYWADGPTEYVDPNEQFITTMSMVEFFAPVAPEALGDTWERSAAGQWTSVAAADPEGDGDPTPAAQPWMAYDPTSQLTLLFDSSAQLLWGYNGVSWRQLDATDTEGDGEPLTFGPTAIDADTGELWMLSNALWRFAGGSWMRVGPLATGAPAPGALRVVAVDPASAGSSELGIDGNGAVWARASDGWILKPVTDLEGDGFPAPGGPIAAFSSPSDPSLSMIAADPDGVWAFTGNSWRRLIDEAIGNVEAILDVGDDTIALISAFSDVLLYQGGVLINLDSLAVSSDCAPYGWCDGHVVDVDRRGAGAVVTLATPASILVQVVDSVNPPSFSSAAIVPVGGAFQFYAPWGCYDYGAGCAADGYEMCGYNTPQPTDVVVDGDQVLLFGGAEVTFSASNVGNEGWADPGDVSPCWVPWESYTTARTLGGPGQLTANPEIGLSDPLGVGGPDFSLLRGVSAAGGPLFYENARRQWRLKNGVSDLPAALVAIDPETYQLPGDALTAIHLSVDGSGTGGLTFYRWDGQHWQQIGAGSSTLAVAYETPSEVTAAWHDRREPIRFAVASAVATAVTSSPSTVNLSAASARLRFVLP